MRLEGGGRIAISEAATWSDGELSTVIVVAAGARMRIDGATEKRLSRHASSTPLSLIENAGELTIAGPGRLFMLYDAQIANSGRVILLPSANVQGSRCCVAPISGIVGTGSVALGSGFTPPLPFPQQAVLANVGLETSGPIDVAAGHELILDGGEHRLADEIRVQGGGKLTLMHARATVVRTNLAPDTTLEIVDRSALVGAVRFGGKGLYRWTGGGVEGNLLVERGARVSLAGSDRKTFGAPDGNRRGLLRNEGTVEWIDDGELRLHRGPAGSAQIENAGLLRVGGNGKIVATSCCSDPSVLANAGTFERRGATGDVVFSGVFINNTGKIEIAEGRVKLEAGAQFLQSSGTTVLRDGAVLTAQSVDLRGGALHGAGRIEGTLNNLAGEVAPGGLGAARTLAVTGDYNQGFDGTLLLEVGGPVSADLLEVDGTVRLAGERIVALLGGFRPSIGQEVEVARYGGRHGTFTRVSGLDIAPGLHFWALYREAALNGPGSLRLQAQAEALPTECRRPSQTLDWPGSKNVVAQILSQSAAATDAFRAIQGRYRVLTQAAPSGVGHLGATGRPAVDSDNRNLIAFQFAWPDLQSQFHLTSIFVHEMAHGRQALRQGFTNAEAAPFVTRDQYTTLRRRGEEIAFRLQGTALTETADAVPDFERCRAELLNGDPRLLYFTAGRIEDMRNEIADYYPRANIGQEWAKNAQVSPAELARLADVKTKVEALLRTQDWQSREAIWQSRP